MKKTLIISATVLAAAGLALSGCSVNPGIDPASTPGPSATSSSSTPGPSATSNSSTPGMSGMPEMSGDGTNTTPATPDGGTKSAGDNHNAADTTFAQLMIPHHEDAITMSDGLLGKEGIDSRVMALADRIKAEQTPEIDQLNASLEAWGEPAGMPGGMDGSMGGSMGGGDMQALDAAQGTEASTVFLEQMIIHHTSAIAMAEQEAANGSDADTVKLAESIVSSQKAQIQEMKDLLTTL
ncbi:DUF305 domain-containing protein [Arthrobacter sp. Hz1]